LFVACALVACNPDAGGATKADDAAVLRAILATSCRAFDGRFDAISDLPASAERVTDLAADAKLAGEITSSLLRRASSSEKWAHVDVCASRRVVNGTEVDGLIARSGRIPTDWADFYAAYPGVRALCRLSLPAYTRDRTSAVVLGACAHDFYAQWADEYLLEKTGSQWRLRDRRVLWVRSF
jgi:hypothetical protein